MRETYATQSVDGRTRMTETLVAEVNGLLAVSLDLPSDLPGDFDGLMELLTHALDRAIEDPDYRYGAAETRALVSALTLDRDTALRGFLSDLSEILFLPREQRSEYTSNRRAAPPYHVRKLLLEYAALGRHLDELVGVISKAYCAQHCEKAPVGCCHILGYDLGLVPEVMLDLQRLEAVRRGWQPPATEENCRYHTATGCSIALFKSPACVGYLCEPLTCDLRARQGGPELDRFLRELSVFNNCDLGRRKIFHAMKDTIDAGRALVAVG